ncbi:hypothetical protein Q8A67_005229 [Cirrhinus molitorella]|uniref:C-type lectin domain-containing protein n=1 Tax=Cirrhinus molitorella TaxID=172907 RepID=A0AA88TVL9_9TELE|nr:hypothetical protein Q8A67_005229 [Cirrhinus molitorella]
MESGPDGKALKQRGSRYDLYMSDEAKSWSDSRQYCRDHGGDLVIINSEEKLMVIHSYIKQNVWIGLSDIENEGSLKWVDNSPLKQGFFSPFEPNDAGGNEDCHFQTTSKRGYLWGPDGLFMSNEEKSWADSRQYCKDRGADLVIINSEEKQRHISSFIKDKVWIGLSDTQNKGNMKWVDNSPLNQGFWAEGEPNNYRGKNEDCIEMRPSDPVLNNWNDVLCSEKKKGICEK